jgi:membrane protein YdbS with pleckstrin-like domain
MQTLDRRVIKVWRYESLSESVIFLMLGAGAAFLIWLIDLPRWVMVLPILVSILLLIGNILIVPPRRWQSWRYAVGTAEIELRQGIWWQSRTRIPMARIQHVDTRRGPIDRRYGVAVLVLYTAAGARQIPGLAIEVAEQLRDQIALLANVRDDV